MVSKSDPISVLVLRVHHGSLAIARSLGRLGVPVHGVNQDLALPAFRSRYWAGRHRWNFSTASPASSVAFLLELGRHLGKGTILIPTSDDTAQLVADHAGPLEAWFGFQRNSPDLVRSLASKRTLYELARQYGIPTPHTVFPSSADEVQEVASTSTFPVMLKASDGLRLQARTGKKMVIVDTPAQLLEQYISWEDPDNPNLMIQEYIPGGDDSIWMFNGYFNAQSDCVFGITGRKLRQFPVHTGSTALGVCLHNPQVHDLTCRLAKSLGYIGILDIGFRFDARDDSYKLLDPNPRIGSSFRLFTTRDGHDVARYLYWDLTGRPMPPAQMREGRKWMVEDQDLESVLDYRREGLLTWGGWMRSLRGLEEAAWFAWDDPKPFLGMAAGLLKRAVGRIGKPRRLSTRPAQASSGTVNRCS